MLGQSQAPAKRVYELDAREPLGAPDPHQVEQNELPSTSTVLVT